MTKEDPLKNWQLEQRGEELDQWKLQDTEQDLDKHLQLQQPDVTTPEWQPVEYERDPRPRRRNWVLPSIVIVALLAVLAYVGWVAFGQFGGGGLDLGAISVGGFNLAELVPGAVVATPTATPTEESAVVTAPTPEPVPTVEPTALPTPEATATTAPLPTPTLALVELITGTVNAVGGVNARTNPTTTAEIMTLLNLNEPVTVVGEQEGWLQVILPDNRVAWVSADFIDRVAQQVLLEELNARRVAAGLQPIVPATSPGSEATTLPGAQGTTPGVQLPVTVVGDPGINARSSPVDGVIVTTILTGTTLTAIGQSADNQWLAVQLPDDGGVAWVVAQFVTAEGDLATLPVVDPATIAAVTADATTTAVTSTVPGVAAPILVTGDVTPPAPFTNTLPLSGPAVAITDTDGVNVRAEAGTDGAVLLVVPNGAVLPVVGRNADATWLQVALPDGRRGWIFAAAVSASPDAVASPVVGEAPVAGEETAGSTATATVSNPLGANLRSVPDRDLDPFTTAEAGSTLTATGRSADGEWVRVRLEDGTVAWALAATITFDTDANELPVVE